MVEEKEPRKLRLLVGSESSNVPTGYSVVMKNLVLGLIKKDWEVLYIGWQRYGNPEAHGDNDGNTWVEVQAGGQMGTPGYPEYLGSYMDEFKPDIVFSLIDIFYVDQFIKESNKRALPYCSYWPIDNPNFNLDWMNKLKYMSYPLTISKFGVDVVEKAVALYGAGGWKHHLKVDYIYHGVDDKVFKRFPKDMIERNRKLIFANKEMYPAGENTFVYFFCGKNCRRKQIDRLLAAFSIVAKKYRDVTLFLKVGDPRNVHGLGLDIGDLLQKFNIVNRVRILDKKSNFLSGISDVELAGWYNISDVHVSATAGEGFGLTTIESMACGKPVIITDCSTSPELIGNNERGWLVPAITKSYMDYNGLWSMVDIEKLAEAMEDAYLHRKETQRRGNNAFKWVRKYMTWDKIVDQFDKYLRNAIEEYSAVSEEDIIDIMSDEKDDKET